MLPSLNGGGAERAAVQVLNGLDAARWHRSMYLFERQGPYVASLHDGIDLESGQGKSRFARWCELRRFFQRTRPDLVMSFLSYFSVLTAARAAAIRARVVFNQQTPMSSFLSDEDYHWRRPWQRRAFTLTTRVGYRFADAILATSNGVADDLVVHFGVPSARIRVVHNPVDLGRLAAAAAEPLDADIAALWSSPAIVAAGRLADAKNYPLLFDAFAEVRRVCPARLFVLGEGERDASLRAHAQRLGLAEQIVFCGFRANPWKYMARAGVFALSSRYEGFGNVVVEAMACGAPVVATSSPGTREIIDHGIDGVLVDQHEPGALAAAMVHVLTDGDLRARLIAQGLRTAARFALPTVVSQYDRIMDEVLA